MPAHGGNRPPPWSGGTTRVTPFEAQASTIATSLAGDEVSIECLDPVAWRALSVEYGFDRALTWALTPLDRDPLGSTAPAGRSSFSPRACRLGDAFSANPTERGARTCRHGTTTRVRTLPARRGKKARTIVVHVPLLGECDDWGQKLVAVHVLSHESMHLAGVIDEAEADCLAVQLDAFVAAGLGARSTFARSLAREYWTYYYGSENPGYRSPACRDGGSLDLFPRRRGWPTPAAYPANLARSIQAFRLRVRSVDRFPRFATSVGSESLVRGVTKSSRRLDIG